MQSESGTSSVHRLKIAVRGAVQGVGFRPFVYRLARSLGLQGWVLNSPQGVFIEAEGGKELLDTFLLRIDSEKPPRSFIQSLEASFLDPAGYADFVIRESLHDGEHGAIIMPDIATCPDCLREIFDPSDRRYLYPFTNCTNCGPRYSIIDSLPYDRPHTSMRKFTMCPDCREEYENPLNRRFHAQPNACPACGPRIELWDPDGDVVANHHLALQVAAEVIRTGGIVALKGIGGFHLIANAGNEDAIRRLRTKKHREEKPLAIMAPSLAALHELCVVSGLEERLLTSPESPIVLLRKRPGVSPLAVSVAPGNPFLGAMLPYSPLHYILMRELGFPIVATSGNLTDEPICTDEDEALRRLSEIADIFLVHNRPIVRHVDDSVARILLGREQILRRARGYAPLPIEIANPENRVILAVGAHLKNSVALTVGSGLVVSQHIGDLATQEANRAFLQVVDNLTRIYNVLPSALVCDMHPDYLSTKYAATGAIEHIKIQHHCAHVASCMADNQLTEPVLGVSWDGTGYGTDRTIWGGEFLLARNGSFERVATFRSFALPGGDASIKQPRRTAIGLLFEMFGSGVFDRNDLAPLRSFSRNQLYVLRTMLERRINSPRTTSAGRLFDAVASIIDLRQECSFEGQGATELEFLAATADTREEYSAPLVHPEPGMDPARPLYFDWKPMINSIMEDLQRSLQKSIIAAKFHNTLAACIVEVAKIAGMEKVVLSGGCFQNSLLSELAVTRLRDAGFRPYWHQRIPPNDGGIAAGQAFAALQIVTAGQNSLSDNPLHSIREQKETV
jgi:hydrogenase maturation protein HypF